MFSSVWISRKLHTWWFKNRQLNGNYLFNLKFGLRHFHLQFGETKPRPKSEDTGFNRLSSLLLLISYSKVVLRGFPWGPHTVGSLHRVLKHHQKRRILNASEENANFWLAELFFLSSNFWLNNLRKPPSLVPLQILSLKASKTEIRLGSSRRKDIQYRRLNGVVKEGGRRGRREQKSWLRHWEGCLCKCLTHTDSYSPLEKK